MIRILGLSLLLVLMAGEAQAQKQIADYGQTGAFTPSDKFLLQQGPKGTLYTWGTPAQLFALLNRADVSGTSTVVPTLAGAGYPGTFTDNPGSTAATIANAATGISLVETNFGSNNINDTCKALPSSTAYTATARVTVTQEWQAGLAVGGLGLRKSGTGALLLHGLAAVTDGSNPHKPAVVTNTWTNATTSAGVELGRAYTWSPSVWLRIQDTASLRIFSWSADGVNWYVINSAAKDSTYNQLCLFISANGSWAATAVGSYVETLP